MPSTLIHNSHSPLKEVSAGYAKGPCVSSSSLSSLSSSSPAAAGIAAILEAMIVGGKRSADLRGYVECVFWADGGDNNDETDNGKGDGYGMIGF